MPGNDAIVPPLPTYPFERQHYWVEPQRQEDVTNTPRRFLPKEPDIANWFYVPSWKRSMPPQLWNQGGLADQQACWLVFRDSCGVGAQIIAGLERQGQDVITVLAGAQFAQI